MTSNDSWAYLAGDNNWKASQQMVQNLVECARDGGNYLLDIGPRADGSVPEPSVVRLKEIGQWLQRNGDCVYATQKCRFPHGNIGAYTRKGNTLYTVIYFWPGETMTVGGVTFKVKSARFLASPLHAKGNSADFFWTSRESSRSSGHGDCRGVRFRTDSGCIVFESRSRNVIAPKP